MNTLTSPTLNYSDSGKNIALALMGGCREEGTLSATCRRNGEGKLQGEDVRADHRR